MLGENDQVEFEIEKGPKGLNAVNVKVVKQFYTVFGTIQFTHNVPQECLV